MRMLLVIRHPRGPIGPYVAGRRGHIADREGIRAGGTKVPSRRHLVLSLQQRAAQQKIAAQRFQDMLPGTHGSGIANRQRFASRERTIAVGQQAIRGIMLESHLVGGSQKVIDGKAATYGQSITDACLAIEDTLPLLDKLASSLR